YKDPVLNTLKTHFMIKHRTIWDEIKKKYKKNDKKNIEIESEKNNQQNTKEIIKENIEQNVNEQTNQQNIQETITENNQSLQLIEGNNLHDIKKNIFEKSIEINCDKIQKYNFFTENKNYTITAKK
ncbi:13647_t:CDS:1, partial [Cetraspora pellucida]